MAAQTKLSLSVISCDSNTDSYHWTPLIH